MGLNHLAESHFYCAKLRKGVIMTAIQNVLPKKSKSLVLSHSLLWFGAAVSIAEIYTGAMLAPLGFQTAAFAIVLGHLVGFLLLFATGLIGAKTNLSAMAGTAPVFGPLGAKYFAFMNVLQLIGWTAVMIIGGARSVASLGIGNISLWTIAIGVMVLIWILLGLQHLGKLNNLAVLLLFVLTLMMSTVIFKAGAQTVSEGQMSFGLAFELSVAMPLSWLPLIADYTRQGGRQKRLSLVSAGAYTLGSTWMYLIGLGAALYVGSADVTVILGAAGLGLVAVLIVILSTVTTTFLDVYSAGESAKVLIERFSIKQMAAAVTVIGTLVALFTPIESYQSFLYWIGSVFAPMVAILLTNHYGKLTCDKPQYKINCALWLVGFVLYRQFIALETPLGATVPVMLVIGILTYASHQLYTYMRKDA